MRKSIVVVALPIALAAVSLSGCGKAPNATAILRVNRGAAQGTTRAEYMVYKQTHASLLKSAFVCESAVRSLDNDEIRHVTANELSRDLKVEVVDETELIVATLSTRNRTPEQTCAVLEAVIEAYQREIISKERMEKVDALTSLRSRYRKLVHDIESHSDSSELGDGMETETSDEKLSALQLSADEIHVEIFELERELQGPARVAVVQAPLIAALGR